MGLLGCGALLAWATALSFFDIRERRLPNALTLSGAAVLLVVAVGTGHGATALAGALGLMLPPVRKAAGWGLALYALCVWPANIHHALANVAINGETLSWWYHGPRLALQPLIIWWALWASGATDWPFGKRTS